MANVEPRLEATADTLAGLVIEIRGMLADGRIDAGEIARLAGLAGELGLAALAVEDISLDYRLMDQIWRLGRSRAPNPPLATRLRDWAAVAQNEAPQSGELCEARVTGNGMSAP